MMRIVIIFLSLPVLARSFPCASTLEVLVVDGRHLAFSLDARLAIDRYRQVDILDPQQGFLFSLGDKRERVSGVKFSPDGKYLIRETEKLTEVFDVHAKSLLYSLPERHPVFFRPHTSELVQFTETEIRLREISSGKIIRRTRLFSDPRRVARILVRNEKTQATLDPTGQYLLFYQPGRGYVFVWDITTWQMHGEIPYFGDAGLRGPPIGFSPTGKYFYVSIWNHNKNNSDITIWETKSNRPIAVHEGIQIVFSQGDDFYSISRVAHRHSNHPRGAVSVISLTSNSQSFSLSQTGYPQSTLAFSSDQKYFFEGSLHRDIFSLFRVYDLASSERVVQLKTPYAIKRIVPSPDGRFVILLMDKGNYLVYCVAEKKIVLSSSVLPSSNIDEWVVSDDGQFTAYKGYGSSYVLNLGRLWQELGSSSTVLP